MHLHPDSGRAILAQVKDFVDQAQHEPSGGKGTGLDAIFFFGAGCVDSKAREVIRGLVNESFPKVTVHVDSDITGVTRAAFGPKESGLLMVLGTGTIVASVRDGRLVWRFPALGAILGDEGSSTALGKALYRAWFRSPETADLHSEIKARGGFPPYGEAMQQFYSAERPPSELTRHAARILAPPLGAALTGLVKTEFDRLLQALDPLLPDRTPSRIVLGGGVVDMHRDILLDMLRDRWPESEIHVLGSIIQALAERAVELGPESLSEQPASA